MNCIQCGKEVSNLKKEFRDDISRKEFGISHLCQQCQDSVFDVQEPEQPETDISKVVINWNDKQLTVQKEYYGNGRVALLLNDRYGENIAIATINVPDQIIAPNEVIIKDYSENKGITEALIAAKVISLTGKVVKLPYAQVPICRLLI